MRYSAVFAGFVAIAASAPVDLPAVPVAGGVVNSLPLGGVTNTVDGVVSSLPVGDVTGAVNGVKLPVKRAALDVPAVPTVPAVPNVGLPVDVSKIAGQVDLPEVPELPELPVNLPVKRQTGVGAVDSAVGQVTEIKDEVTGTVGDVVNPVVDEVSGTVHGVVDPVVEGVTGTVHDVADPVVGEVSGAVQGIATHAENVAGLKRDILTAADPKIEATLQQVAGLLQSILADEHKVDPSVAVPAVAPVLDAVNAKRAILGLPVDIPGVDLSALTDVLAQLELIPTVELLLSIVTGLLH